MALAGAIGYLAASFLGAGVEGERDDGVGLLRRRPSQTDDGPRAELDSLMTSKNEG
jgi:hypothetical protein